MAMPLAQPPHGVHHRGGLVEAKTVINFSLLLDGTAMANAQGMLIGEHDAVSRGQHLDGPRLSRPGADQVYDNCVGTGKKLEQSDNCVENIAMAQPIQATS